MEHLQLLIIIAVFCRLYSIQCDDQVQRRLRPISLLITIHISSFMMAINAAGIASVQMNQAAERS